MTPHRIDVHNHILPPAYLQAVGRHGHTSGGNIPFPSWTAEEHLALMDRTGIQTAITSVASPGVFFGDRDEARGLARTVNEIQARLMSDHPTRFGAFASVPVPNTEDSLAEVTHALDTLKLDGVIMLASVGDTYLGDPSQEELFAELNRRKAVMFVHPNIPVSSLGLKLTVPAALIEFVFDTTRAVTNLIFSGMLDRYPDVKIILSHAGGTLPFLAGRLNTFGKLPKLMERAPKGALHYLKRLYYDTAISAFSPSLNALRDLVDPTHILFGSDYPFLPEPQIQEQIAGVADFRGFGEADRLTIEREAALTLFPRLRG